MSLKIPVLPPGIDPGTARLVAQRLNHDATPGPTVEVPTVNMAKINSTEVILMKCVTKSKRNREIRSNTNDINKILFYIRPLSKF
jgi:hypothetical protein